MTPFETFITTYGGWIGLVVFVLVDKVVPLLFDKIIPASLKRADEERESRMKALEEERLADLAERAEDRKFRRQMDAERAEELKAIRQAMEAMNNNLTQVNASLNSVRLAETDIITNQRTILDKQDDHHNAMLGAISSMRESVARRDGIAEGKKLPKTGPIGDKDTKPS